MTPTEKLVRCREIWRNTMEYRAEGEGCVMKLMRHPDTTPEQLQECRQIMLSIEEMMRDAVTSLRRAYPKQKSLFLTQAAWWADEYNRYEVKHGD